ncbi:hypothetical protein [Maritimibacter alexandrii]|uniref:hypothetical protein n=1 Tax=Maritimibacter alexandrii TaxID=2570355 RepID=UPI001108A598|nr:hypothetical protein [Maritimibacter alexandrii]
MNIERMITMVVRMVLGRLVHKGVDAGIDYASRRGKPQGEMTAEDRQRAKAANQTARRAKQASKLVRRIR